MPRSVATHLMFYGVAEEALNFYKSVFPGISITKLDRNGAGDPGPEGTLKRATFTFYGQEFIVFNSPVKHDFTFTPAVSLFIDCETLSELENAYSQLSEGGTELMPLNNYGFSTKFGWINDRFGVSWQLNLP